MSIASPRLRVALFAAAILAAGCSAGGLLPARTQSDGAAVAAAPARSDLLCRAFAALPAAGTACGPQVVRPALRPMVGYTYEFKNGTSAELSWHRLGENCMKENVPNVNGVKPDQTLKYAVDTNTGCCRCSHETSWFVLQYRAPNGDYRDVGFDKPLGKDWEISNRGSKGDLYFCRQLGGASIKGVMIRGDKCP
jgi:hypothetical protein